MRTKPRNNGTVLLLAVFIIALLSVMVMGMLEENTEETQLMSNHIFAAQALGTAEAGLNDALAEIRADSSWSAGYNNEPFNGGSYSVVVNGSTITSTGTSAEGFIAKVEADITVGSSGPPYLIRVDNFRINE
jgi:Tfp pilus assembly protein PilX